MNPVLSAAHERDLNGLRCSGVPLMTIKRTRALTHENDPSNLRHAQVEVTPDR